MGVEAADPMRTPRARNASFNHASTIRGYRVNYFGVPCSCGCAVSPSATAFNSCIQGQIRLTRHLVIGSQGRTAITPPAVLIAVREYILASSRYMVRYAVCRCPLGMTRPPRSLSYER